MPEEAATGVTIPLNQEKNSSHENPQLPHRNVNETVRMQTPPAPDSAQRPKTLKDLVTALDEERRDPEYREIRDIAGSVWKARIEGTLDERRYNNEKLPYGKPTDAATLLDNPASYQLTLELNDRKRPDMAWKIKIRRPKEDDYAATEYISLVADSAEAQAALCGYTRVDITPRGIITDLPENQGRTPSGDLTYEKMKEFLARSKNRMGSDVKRAEVHASEQGDEREFYLHPLLIPNSDVPLPPSASNRYIENPAPPATVAIPENQKPTQNGYVMKNLDDDTRTAMQPSHADSKPSQSSGLGGWLKKNILGK